MYTEFTTKIGCINNCVYCPQKTIVSNYFKGNNHIVTQMSFASFKKMVEKLPKKMDISLCGMSEPFQNPECTRMILYAAKRGHIVYVCTTFVKLSLKDLHVLISQVFKKNNDHTLIIHLPSKRNIERIQVDEDYLKKIEMIVRANINTEFHYHDKAINPIVAKKLEELHVKPLFIEPQSRANNLIQEGIAIQKRRRGRLRCYRHELHGHVIFPDGRAVLCCMDYQMKHVLGNLLQSPYNSVHAGKANTQLNEDLLHDNAEILCRYCHAAKPIDGYSTYLNMDASFQKTFLGIKLVVYNRVFFLYSFIHNIKRIQNPAERGTATKSKKHWLYAPELQ